MTRTISLTLLLLSAGCGTTAFDRSQLSDIAFGGGSDAGDTAAPDTDAPDLGPVPDTAGGLDIIAPPDTSTTDTSAGGDTSTGDVPPVCPPGTTWCEDDVLVTCADDGSGVGRIRCDGRGLICVTNEDGSAACAEPVVVPTECPLPGAEEIGPGSYAIDLCAQGDDAVYVPQGDCDGGEARTGADAVFTFTLPAPTDVFVDFRDDDDGAAIDTILYVREVCDDPESQVACSDDLPCDESDVDVGCNRGIQVRQSRLSLSLDAGTYAIVADHFQYREFGCGQTLLILDY